MTTKKAAHKSKSHHRTTKKEKSLVSTAYDVVTDLGKTVVSTGASMIEATGNMAAKFEPAFVKRMRRG